MSTTGLPRRSVPSLVYRIAAVAALGVSGFAIASTNPPENPPPIELDDQRNLDVVVTTVTTRPDFEVVPGQGFTIDTGESLDSPLASGDLDTGSADSPDVSPDQTADSPDSHIDSADSPDKAPSPTVNVSADSPDSPDSAPTPDSADSPASADSADSLDS